MICKKCNGKGYIYTNAFGTKGILRCDVCGGNGKILSNQQTNEEWFCQLSTEEKAHQLHLMTTSCYVCGADGVDYKRCYFRKECTGEADIEDWLKAVRKE